MLIQELLQISSSVLAEDVKFKDVKKWESTIQAAAKACVLTANHDGGDGWKDAKRKFTSFEQQLEDIGETIATILEKQVPWTNEKNVDMMWDAGFGKHDFDFDVEGGDGDVRVGLYVSVEGNRPGTIDYACQVSKGGKIYAAKTTKKMINKDGPGSLIAILDELNKGIQKLQKEWENAPMISPQGKK